MFLLFFFLFGVGHLNYLDIYQFNPVMHGGGGFCTCSGFLPFTKKSECNPYLKFLEFSQLSVADAIIGLRIHGNPVFSIIKC